MHYSTEQYSSVQKWDTPECMSWPLPVGRLGGEVGIDAVAADQAVVAVACDVAVVVLGAVVCDVAGQAGV